MSRFPTDRCPRLHDAAPYLLGALDDPGPFRVHVEDCAECREELAQLVAVADSLDLTPPAQRMPHELRERLIDRVTAEAEVLGAAGPIADLPLERPSRRRWHAFGLTLVATLATVLVVVVLLVDLDSPHTRTYGAIVAPTGASAQLRQTGSRAEVLVANMPQPPLGKVYEVWLARGPGTLPTPTDALFSVTNHGEGSVIVPNSLAHVSEVMVTSEPLGGSARPTGLPLLRFRL
jgi:hypothetical protein